MIKEYTIKEAEKIAPKECWASEYTEDERIRAISTLISSLLDGLKMEEAEIRYEELDTGIGINKLEYDTEDNHEARGWNKAVKEFNDKIEGVK